jgi:hypothetical protein
MNLGRLSRRWATLRGGDGMNIGLEIPAVDQLQIRCAFFGEVNVSVRQPRDGRSTFEIDGLGFWAGQTPDVVGLPGCNDARSGARDCFLDPISRNEAADFTIE